MYHDGWKAVVFHPMPFAAYDGSDPFRPFDEDEWDLYHVAEDFSETVNLAAQRPDKLAEMVELWWSEAEAHNVLPLTNMPQGADSRYRREHYEFYSGTGSLPEVAAPRLRNRGWRAAAQLTVPDDGCEGVIATHGSASGGYVIFVKDGRLQYAYNHLGSSLTTVPAEVDLPPGPVTVRVEFTPTGRFEGDVALFYGDVLVGQGHVARTTRVTYGVAGFSVGSQRGSAVSPAYSGRFPFTDGALGRVVFEPDGRPYRDPSGEAAAGMAIQ
jgi:arylsulfatase